MLMMIDQIELYKLGVDESSPTTTISSIGSQLINTTSAESTSTEIDLTTTTPASPSESPDLIDTSLIDSTTTKVEITTTTDSTRKSTYIQPTITSAYLNLSTEIEFNTIPLNESTSIVIDTSSMEAYSNTTAELTTITEEIDGSLASTTQRIYESSTSSTTAIMPASNDSDSSSLIISSTSTESTSILKSSTTQTIFSTTYALTSKKLTSTRTEAQTTTNGSDLIESTSTEVVNEITYMFNLTSIPLQTNDSSYTLDFSSTQISTTTIEIVAENLTNYASETTVQSFQSTISNETRTTTRKNENFLVECRFDDLEEICANKVKIFGKLSIRESYLIREDGFAVTDVTSIKDCKIPFIYNNQEQNFCVQINDTFKCEKVSSFVEECYKGAFLLSKPDKKGNQYKYSMEIEVDQIEGNYEANFYLFLHCTSVDCMKAEDTFAVNLKYLYKSNKQVIEKIYEEKIFLNDTLEKIKWIEKKANFTIESLKNRSITLELAFSRRNSREKVGYLALDDFFVVRKLPTNQIETTTTAITIQSTKYISTNLPKKFKISVILPATIIPSALILIGAVILGYFKMSPKFSKVYPIRSKETSRKNDKRVQFEIELEKFSTDL